MTEHDDHARPPARPAARPEVRRASRPGPAARGDAGRPEKTELTIGFIPLTDCASVVMAAELGLYRKYGLNVTVSREASWAAVRDKLVLGRLDAAHAPYSLVYGVHLGLSGQRKDMAVLMTLNQNGQSITLSNRLRREGATDGAGLKRLIDGRARACSFAQTFPTGTHALWLYYWLAAHGIDPFRDVKTIVVPPPQMVAGMRCGHMDGFCVGEPWGARAVAEGIGFTAATTQAIWPDHPEKVLGATREFVERHPNTARALTMALLEASRILDTMANRGRVAAIVAGRAYVDAPAEEVLDRFAGRYRDGLGRQWTDANHLKFFADGEVTFPYYSHGMWFLTQMKRWGLLKGEVDYLAVARRINQVELYREAAGALGIAVPAEPLKSETLFDGRVWNPAEPARYAGGFAIAACEQPA